MTQSWQEIRAKRTVYEDDDLLIIDKPTDLSVHPERSGDAPSISEMTKQVDEFLMPVHRLDKPTSGILVLAKSQAVSAALQTQFRSRSAPIKHYLLITRRHNALDPDFDQLLDMASINLPLKARKGLYFVPHWKSVQRDVGRKRYALPPDSDLQGAQSALTTYGVVSRVEDMTLVVAQLVTGRTHQLRVHFRSAQHPVVGDTKYSPAAEHDFSRMSLHAWKLQLRHPVTGRDVVVTSEPDAAFWKPLEIADFDMNAAAKVADALTVFTQS